MLVTALFSALAAALVVTMSASPGPNCGQRGAGVAECSQSDCQQGQPSCDQGSAAVLPVPGSVPAIV